MTILRIIKKTAMVVCVVLLLAPFVFGLPHTNSYKAVWDANTETDLAGYYLYWRVVDGVFIATDKIDTQLITECDLSAVPSDTILAVTAYDTSGNESGYSNEVNFTKDLLAPAAPGGLQIAVE